MLPNYVCFWDRWGNRKENETDGKVTKICLSGEMSWRLFALLSYGWKKENAISSLTRRVSKAKTRTFRDVHQEGGCEMIKLFSLQQLGNRWQPWESSREIQYEPEVITFTRISYVFIYGWNIFQLLSDCEIAPFKRLLLHLQKSLWTSSFFVWNAI